MHDPDHGLDPDEDFRWLAGADLGLITAEGLASRVTGVHQEEVEHYLLELKAILWDHFRPGKDAFPTIKVVRSAHVRDIIRQNPGVFPHLAKLSDREVLRISSMLLRDMQAQILNNKNRGKFVVQGVEQ